MSDTSGNDTRGGLPVFALSSDFNELGDGKDSLVAAVPEAVAQRRGVPVGVNHRG